MTEQEIEQEIQDKGLTDIRLTPEDIDKQILYAEYYRVDNTTTTICALVLKNNYVVVGKSAAISMNNFDEELGKKIAFDDAREQIWALEGYYLKSKQKEINEPTI